MRATALLRADAGVAAHGQAGGGSRGAPGRGSARGRNADFGRHQRVVGQAAVGEGAGYAQEVVAILRGGAGAEPPRAEQARPAAGSGLGRGRDGTTCAPVHFEHIIIYIQDLIRYYFSF